MTQPENDHVAGQSEPARGRCWTQERRVLGVLVEKQRRRRTPIR